jgi:2-polyprenyl-3-methyl-5-hydroxy-6-metoxy-1,4-benzoquinol methylase
MKVKIIFRILIANGLYLRKYHFVKNIALKTNCNLSIRSKSKGKILDIGAGTGDFLSVAMQDGWETTGIEPVTDLLRLNFFCGKHAGLSDHSFDVVSVALETHIPDLDLQIKELKEY